MVVLIPSMPLNLLKRIIKQPIETVMISLEHGQKLHNKISVFYMIKLVIKRLEMEKIIIQLSMWSKSIKFFQSMMIIPAIATFYLFDSKVISIRATTGQSMSPTIKQDSVLIIDKIFYKIFNQGIKKGDIVVGNQPVNPKIYICKRVIQTGGNSLPNYPHIKIPPGNFWLEGDNKPVSYDSRHHGCVPEHLIEGKVIFVIPI